jgi:leader peptidase (prepilin peptidase)/N-methyltransferase
VAFAGGVAGIWAPYALGELSGGYWRSWYARIVWMGIVVSGGAVYGGHGFHPHYLPFVWALIVLALADAKDQSVRVVDLVITTCLAIPLMHPKGMVGQLAMIAGILAILGILKIALGRFYGKNALGGADIWLMAVLFVALPGPLALVALYAAILLSGVVGGLLLLFTSRTRTSRVAFIPYVLMGVLVALLAGDVLLTHYDQWRIMGV